MGQETLADRLEIAAVVSEVETMSLPHPSGALLLAFIAEALDPLRAARYVTNRLSTDDPKSIVSDWTYIVRCMMRNELPPQARWEASRKILKRDGFRCCLTGKLGTRWDPLVVVPVTPIPSGWVTEKPHISDMLGAFFGPQYRDWWLSYVTYPGMLTPYQSHWSLRKSVVVPFASGRVRLDRLTNSMIEFEINDVLRGPEEPIARDGNFALLGDYSRSGILKVDPRFIGTHARFSKSIRYLCISDELAASDVPDSQSVQISPPEPGPAPGKRLTIRRVAMDILWAPWPLLPRSLRLAAYRILKRLGKFIYGGPGDSSNVQKLPFGYYLKAHMDKEELRNEFNAMHLVWKHTSIPIPRPLDMVIEPPSLPFTGGFLLLTRIPGVPLSRCQHVLSDRDCAQIAHQMDDYLRQLREIPYMGDASISICNSLGEACRDPRVRGGQPVGPFADEASFSQMLRYADDPLRRGHKIFFTHADLNPRNVMVERFTRRDGTKGWRVSGIIDWEAAGYYPEYWDSTKSMFESFRWSRRYNELITSIFAGVCDYSTEYALEKKAWESGDGV